MKQTFFILFVIMGLTATAQLPTDFRSEQIYLSLQQTKYLPGDTLLLEGQVTCLAEDRFLPYSNYLYIECFNGQDSVLVRQKVSCKDKGYFNTHLPTGHEWQAGVYYLRAYTQLMRNFSSESFVQQPFLLAKEFPKKEKQVYEAKCNIIPSGGKLIAGHPQTVVVHLTDDCTFPVVAKLQLMSEKGDSLGIVRTSASGMARLSFIPDMNMNYYLTGQIDGKDYRFPLPDATKDVKVQGSLNGKRLSYQILNPKGKGNILYTYDRANGLTRTDIERENGILMMDEAPETMSLFLTDADNRILAEYTLSGKQVRNTGMKLPETIKENETIRYELPEPTEGSRIITRIVAENDLLATSAEKSLKYQADYTSPLPFPRHLYAADGTEFNNDLHAWLSTARFHRFDLKEALEKDSAVYTHLPEQVMTFSGKIEKKNERPLKNGQLVVYRTINDYVYDVPLDSDSARFVLAVDDFQDGEEFYLQAITSKGKPDFANFQLDEETYPALQNNRHFRLPISRYTESEVIIGNDFNLDYSVDKNNERNYTLPSVTVKARLRTEKPKDTHEFYSTNFVSREELENRPNRNLYEILFDMPGLVIEKSTDRMGEERLTVISNRGFSVLPPSNDSGEPMSVITIPLIIDGSRIVDEDQYLMVLETTSPEIESVQFLRPWQALAYTYGAIDGAIIVKTRKFKEKEPLPSKGAMYTPTGLSPLSYPYTEMKASPLACDKAGRYRLLVDVITESGVRSYERAFEVVE